MAKPSKAKVLKKLQDALNSIPSSEKLEIEKAKKWHQSTIFDLKKIFENNKNFEDWVIQFIRIEFEPNQFLNPFPDRNSYSSAYLYGLKEANDVMQLMIKKVEEYWGDEEEVQPEQEKNQKKSLASNSKKVFIIHGHDNGTKNTVARFIEKLALKPVILHVQPNQGRTVIEKFEDYADVGFAIALLTPDDVGNEESKKNKLNPRARQNVIFEFGFFIGKLGRKRVCGIKKDDVEIPSDYKGVLYIDFDSKGSWQMQLVKELQATGIDVDANLAL